MMKPGPFAIVWRYEVAEQHRGRFEAAYGPAGDWARLFGTSPGYLRTDLLAGEDGHYVTIDYWRAETDFLAFQARSGADYAALDARCDALTVSEERIGRFGVRTAAG
jgi:heme-degrading monooxygenase HmoA